MAEINQWEYLNETFGSLLTPMDDGELEAILDHWGEEGGDVVSAFAIPGTYKFRAIAKRPLNQGDRGYRSRPG